MKVKWNIVLSFVVVAALVCFGTVFYIHKSYYPMGGEVTVIDKKSDGSAYYIVIEQPKPMDEERESQFTLKCSSEQYESVSVGDVINCERNQSVLTHKGYVHHIK